MKKTQKFFAKNKLIYNLIRVPYWIIRNLYYFVRYNMQNVFLSEIDKKKHYTLLIDHKLGGGTKLYRNNIIANNISKKKNIMLLENISNYKNNGFLNLSIFTSTYEKEFFIPKSDFGKLFDEYNIEKIICNSLVTYYDYSFFIRTIVMAVEEKNIPVSTLIHDYYSICPKYTLIANNQFCNLECEFYKCKLHYVGSTKELNIIDWRSHWRKLFLNSREIICFSQSSKDIVIKAYPSIDPKNIKVIPHSMDYCNFEPINITAPKKIILGIVGSITAVAKGSLVIEDLIVYNNKLPVEIVIVGDFPIKNKHVKIIGKYNLSNLPDILIDNKINVVLFPSIWPETFSYLVSELIMLNIPIVSFNLGAQAEKIKKYKYGLVCNSLESKDIYNSILSLYKQAFGQQDSN